MARHHQSRSDLFEEVGAYRFRTAMQRFWNTLRRRSAYRHLVAELDMQSEHVQTDVGCSVDAILQLRARS